MSYLDTYRARMLASGSSRQESTFNNTKQQVYNDIMNSPTLSYVRLNDQLEPVPVIASDKETFHKRIFLFVPETTINVGDYIHQSDNATYLAVDQEKDELYPQLIGELCNGIFILKTDATKVKIGVDEFNRPITRDIGVKEMKIPCVMTTKIPSVVDNSAIPLPDGAMIIKIPYNVKQIPKVNYIFDYRDEQYKVTTRSFVKVVNEVGFIEIRLQRET